MKYLKCDWCHGHWFTQVYVYGLKSFLTWFKLSKKMFLIFFIIVHSSQIISINGIDKVAKMQAIEMLIYEDHSLEFLMTHSMVPYVGDFRNLYYRVYLNTMRLFHYRSIKIIWKISNPCGYNNFMFTFVNNYTFFRIKVATKPLSTLVPIVNRLFDK
jgi:hypothetical protein